MSTTDAGAGVTAIRRHVVAVLALGAIAAPVSGQSPSDGDWPIVSKDYANTRFSELAEITTANVATLKVAWTFSTGVLRGQEAAPLVIGNTMYVVAPYPNRLFALDLTRPGSMRWSYDPKPASASQGVACCDVVNRGAAYADGTIFFNTLDAHTVAVDAATGQEKWRTQVGNINIGESMTMAPLVVRDRVIVGVSGGEFGVRGWAAGLDTKTGVVAWRAYSTGPDREVLIGPEFKPFYEMDRGKDLGVKTWPPGTWEIGGGTVWGFISYDPELDLIYYGTGNPGPWSPHQREGDNKWTTGVFARRPSTGEARWFYHTGPHDLFDWDGINESVLVTLPIEGQDRKVMLRPERNGYLYVMDRATGEVLSADPYAFINATKGVDLTTGRLVHAEEKSPQVNKVIRDICPAAPGAKDWNPSAWSPRTKLLYIPHNNLCMDFEETGANYIAGTPFVGAKVKFTKGHGGNGGFFTAWDPIGRRKAWQIPEALPVWSGALATAGDVVFYGTLDGTFKALDARSGALLWQFRTGSGIIGQPMTYRGPDGKQYVAVLSGVGGWAGAVVAGDLDVRDSTAALGWGSAVPELKELTTKGGTLYVFALP
ncbi:MAG TPA: methanol/ethanol family PQQ-dependent dehydrogenase [Gemmatimonadales bacterium]|nr:methanol/ethanol family PQQ-dependent dehydrogenase [Gemmatimonadales bacterium]